ncbi:hypothetical protein N0B51_06870 [Tsuneonella sp. YG55]|uniref:Uncharacterized protein n=1 Tax=Tsuneonella litorea TaxID=2976475 RepID=A0A9X2W0L8_9SPHN|nr:hypothetical protein [Tsuneonella litorea]MCT2558698.1 hypothetical protein [Tsuneonella litorea]
MSEAVMMQSSEAPVEAVLRDELAQGDVVIGTIGPVLGHLLANHDHSLFSDEIVSRVRGMISDLARQVLLVEAQAAGATDPRARAERDCAQLTNRLLTDEKLVGHCHALSLEWQLTARLEKRSAIDPVLSPLLQALIASDDGPTAATAMAALAAQSRFAQTQRRMELPLAELPADLFHQVVAIWASGLVDSTGPDAAAATDALREAYDESASRLGLLSRLVTGMGAGARAALSVGHAGVALFLTALAAAARHDRDLAVISTNDRQLARLALSLRAAGLKPREVEEQFLHLHPDVALPEGFDQLRADRAAALLGGSARNSVA